MAFVYKSEKKIKEKSDDFDNLGPGKYLSHKNYKFKENRVGFLSKTDKLTALKYEKTNKNAHIDLALTSMSNMQNQPQWLEQSLHHQKRKNFENKDSNSVFRSSTKRFQALQKVEDFPGPGTYTSNNNKAEKLDKKNNKKKEIVEKGSIIDEIMYNGNYQPIPSIPSNMHAYGYSDFENFDIQEIRLNKVLNKESQENNLGPGSYEPQNFFDLRRQKGYSWGKKPISHQNLRKIKESSNLGPGTYDIRYEIKPLYQYKPTGSFCSTMSRSYLDQKVPGERAKKLIVQKMKKNLQNNNASSNGNLLDMNLSNEIDLHEASVGPGTYYNEKLASSIKVKSKPVELQNFGSSSLRFDQQKMITTNKTLGPGKYMIKANYENIKMAPLVNVPFMSSNERFENKVIIGIPGPGAYNPKIKINTMNQNKNSNNMNRNFGVNDERFKADEEAESKPGPGTYIDPLQTKKTQYNSNNNFFFKSQSERGEMFKANNMNPGSGSYNVVNHMIENSVKSYNEQDPEILRKKPPFNIQEERFNMPKNGSENLDSEDLDDKNPQIHSKSLGARFLKKPKKESLSANFTDKSPRFKYNIHKSPGPGQYHDQNNDVWNKKTFNIMFADL